MEDYKARLRNGIYTADFTKSNVARIYPEDLRALLAEVEAKEAENRQLADEVKRLVGVSGMDDEDLAAAEAERDRYREALEKAITWFEEYAAKCYNKTKLEHFDAARDARQEQGDHNRNRAKELRDALKHTEKVG